jgi:hypothetical protein
MMGSVAIGGCADKRLLSGRKDVQLELRIYEDLCANSILKPALCEDRSSINTGFFENTDSVMNSVGYVLFDELMNKAISKGKSAGDSIKCQSDEPFIRLSEIVFDSSRNFAMLSYVRYNSPLNVEEVCAIYKLNYSRLKEVVGVELVWAHQISVS